MCGIRERENRGYGRKSGVTLSEHCRQQYLIGRILASPKLSPEEIYTSGN
ncbi:hypothetical protein LJB92_03795 [Bacteroidales bacterium OttesenSCG-928-M06]|nr:hypothetical protein [Bacteroidales bacterium OttesenSCG-928-M06]